MRTGRRACGTFVFVDTGGRLGLEERIAIIRANLHLCNGGRSCEINPARDVWQGEWSSGRTASNSLDLR